MQFLIGNFSIDQVVVELTEIMAQNYRTTQTKHRKAKKRQGWTKLGRIEMDCIWVNNFEKLRLIFFQNYISLYPNVI